MTSLRSTLLGLSTSALMIPAVAAGPFPKAEREVKIVQSNFEKLDIEDQAQVLILKDRLEGILATDRSTLDRSERNELRAEWKELKGKMDTYNRGGTTIYLSTAGIILIILLLIILL